MADHNQHQTPKTNTQPHAHAVGDVVYTEHGRGTVAGFENLHFSGITETDQPDAESYRVIVELETPHPVLERTRLYYSAKEARTRPPFDLPDSGKMTTPFADLHFWQWLSELPEQEAQAMHGIETKRKYLTGLGFIVGDDWLTGDDLLLLRYTMDYYFTSVVRSALYAAHTAKQAGGQGGDV